MGKLKKAMYGMRDAPQIWADTVKEKMFELGSNVSGLHPSVGWNVARGLMVVVYVDDVMCIGSVDALGWLFDSLNKQYDLKRHMLEPDSTKEVKYLNRVLRRGQKGLSGRVIPSMPIPWLSA